MIKIEGARGGGGGGATEILGCVKNRRFGGWGEKSWWFVVDVKKFINNKTLE